MNSKGYRFTLVTEFHNDIVKLQEFGSVLNDYIRACVDHSIIDSESAQILYRLYPRHRVLASFICEHRLRFAEAYRLKARDMFCSESLSIIQPKTGKKRLLDNKFRVRYFRGYTNWDSFIVFPSTYGALKLDIHRCTPNELKAWSSEFKDATHLFRHIWATNRFHEKVSLQAIGKGLGHSNKDSVMSYLHAKIPTPLNLF